MRKRNIDIHLSLNEEEFYLPLPEVLLLPLQRKFLI